MWPHPQETADLVTFTEEILNGKFHFLCSVYQTVLITSQMKIENKFFFNLILQKCALNKMLGWRE